MKRILIIMFATVCGASAFGQSEQASKIGYGLKAGVNLTQYHLTKESTATETKNITNFQVTGYLEAPLGSRFLLQPGISIQGKGGKNTVATTAVKQNTLWLEVPVNLLVKLPASPTSHIYLGGGPYLGFGLSGRNEIVTPTQTSKGDVHFGNDVTDNLTTTDFGVNLLAGIQLNSGFNVGVGHGIGLKSITPSNANNIVSNIYSRVISFTVGYKF
jgi:hypothetical protein